MRTSGIIIVHLNKLWKVKFFIQCDVTFLVKLQGKFKTDPTLGSDNIASSFVSAGAELKLEFSVQFQQVQKPAIRAEMLAGLSKLSPLFGVTVHFPRSSPFLSSITLPSSLLVWTSLTEATPMSFCQGTCGVRGNLFHELVSRLSMLFQKSKSQARGNPARDEHEHVFRECYVAYQVHRNPLHELVCRRWMLLESLAPGRETTTTPVKQEILLIAED